MIGLAVADIHVRASNPQFRIDDYPEVILKKVTFIVNTANKYKATIFIAGDIFENAKVPYEYTNRLIRILRKAKRGIYAIPGQHDQEHHSQNLMNSPYQTLIEAGVIINVNNHAVDGVYGCGWESEREDINESSYEVLLMHYCVTPEEPPFFLQDSAASAHQIGTEHHNAKVIICGDYHIPHIRCADNLLINCGSIGRSSKDQMNYKPRVVLFDTSDPKKYKRIFIPIESADKVFKIPEDIKIDENFSEKMKELAGDLLKKSDRPTFTNTVKFLMIKSKASKRRVQIAQKYILIGESNVK